MAATINGVILGTAAYMSPEQARGKAVDKRTDIWAFGCVLYELLTGKQAFAGEDTIEILAAVVMKEPAFDALPKNTPPSIRVLLQRCLRKDRRQRIPDAAAIRIEIEDTLTAPKDTGAAPAPAASRSKIPWFVAAASAIAALVLGALLQHAMRAVDVGPQPLARLDIDLGPDVSLGSTYGADAILSPDGNRLVYVSHGRLVTRRLDQTAGTELAGTEGGYAPFFSPDGQWVAFFAGGRLKKTSLEGGAVIDLCTAPYGFGGSWGEDGNIIAALGNASALSRISSAGGAPTPATELAQGEITHRWPQILPGGKAVLFTASSNTFGFDGANIEVVSLAEKRRKTVQRQGTYGRYLPSGHLIYINGGTLFAVPFNLEKLEVRGTPIPMLEEVGYSTQFGFAQFDFARNGTLVYRSGRGGSELATVQWLDGAGKAQPLLTKPGNYLHPRLSPNGQRLGLLVADGSNLDLWSYEWQRDTMTRLTFGGTGANPMTVWTPDGRYVVFEVAGGISRTRADGPGQPQPLLQSKNRQVAWSFAPDGKRLAYVESNPTTGHFDLWTVPVETGIAGLRAGKPELFLQNNFDHRHPSFSFDGKWLAYSSNESGSYQVYVRAFPDNGGKWQVSNGDGVYPTWSGNGRELFFRTQDSRTILVATYTVKGDSFVADKPRVWSETPLADAGLNLNFDLAPDGKRISALMPAENPGAQVAQNHVIFLENFFDELRRRVPTGK